MSGASMMSNLQTKLTLQLQLLEERLSAVEDKNKESCCQRSFAADTLEQMHKFYQEEQFCDFNIKVEGRLYKVHRLVLASCSDYFKAMLSHDMMETRLDTTDLKGVTVKGLDPLIHYAYTGDLKLTLENVHEVMCAAMFLQIEKATKLCIAFLKEKMTFENAEELLNIGEIFSIPELKEYYRNYILKNFLQFVETDMFLNLDAETLADYLEDDALVTTSESILFHHCLRWYNHDKENRENDAFIVFEKVRMCVDGWGVLGFAPTVEPFISNEQCKGLLEDCRHYMHEATKRYITNNHRTRVRSTQQTIIQMGGLIRGLEFDDPFEEMLSIPENELRGWDRNHYFHPSLKQWYPLGILGNWITRLSHQKAVEVNDCAILTGGYDYVLDDTVQRICVKDMKMFSAQGHFQFWDMNPMQHGRAHHAAVYLDRCIYVIAGKDDRQSLSSVEKLTCDTETWSYVKALPQKIWDHAAVTCEGKIYVCGGVDRLEVKKNVWCYDPARNNWSKRAPLNSARAGHGVVCIGKFLYTAGGYNSISIRNRCLVSAEKYSVESDQWTKITSLDSGIAHFGMLVLNKRIVILGGVDTAGSLLSTMHEYDPEKDRWKVFGELPRPIKNMACCAVTVKLTDTGCMEDESDEISDHYNHIMDLEDERQAEELHRQQYEQSLRVMENFDPGDYIIDDEADYHDYHDYLDDDDDYYDPNGEPC